MKKKLKLYSVLSLLAGGLLLLSFFIDLPIISKIRSRVLSGAECLLMLILFFSLLGTLLRHIRGIGEEDSVRVVHIVSFAVFLAVLILGFLKGSLNAGFEKLIFMLQQVIESAAAGLVCLGLIYAFYRLPRQKISAFKVAYVIGLIFFLYIYTGLDEMTPHAAFLNNIVDLLKCIPASCLAGLFLGLGLGAAVTGLRQIVTGGNKTGGDR